MSKTILVVEDEQTLQDVIKQKLIINQFEVLTAFDVTSALEIMRSSKKIDVVWLDHYLLGDKNGIDLVVKIKDSTDWKDIPIFVVSNTASPDKVHNYIKLGVKKYYTKANFRLDQIIDDIKSSFEGKGKGEK